MQLVLIIDCTIVPSPRVRAAREAFEDRGCETLVLRRGATELLDHPAEWLDRVVDSALVVLVDAPERLVELTRRRSIGPVVAARAADVEASGERMVC